MARIRTIKPEVWTDEKFVSLTPLSRLLFIGLWNFADDEGRMPYSPVTIKLQILPADDADCSELLGEIRGKEMIEVYEVDRKWYLQVINFNKHQKVDKRLASKYPPPPTPAESPRPYTTEGIKEGIKEGKGVPLAALVAVRDSVVLLKDEVQKHNSGIERETVGVSIPTWSAYADAYRLRYGVEPVRNRQVNAQLAQLVSRLGMEAAPAVASFYVAHDFMLYVRAKHPVNLLLRDAEGLHTEWLRGVTVTSSEAAQADRTAGTGNVFRQLIAELPEEREPMAARGGSDEPY